MTNKLSSRQQAQHIATLFDGTKLIFAQGKFDMWCIYHVSGERKHAIKDEEVFSLLEKYATSPTRFQLYHDFVNIFHDVTHVTNNGVLARIKELSLAYANAREIEFVLMFLYAGMVAEENKKFAKLKKYIKRLGVHQVLIERQRAQVAANYSKGKKWPELQQECDARGFYNNKRITKLIA